ncbi:MAG TPA: phage holin family protein, partial [Candidatus Tumulicola sp.]|nr:phage holin family protein [Candidatus Tumulicola sp.]
MTTQTAARPYELRAQTAKTLLQRLYGELTELTTQEAEMARLEVRERAAMTARAGMISATAAAAALVGFASFAACAIAALAYVLPVWLAALIVGAGCLAAGFALSALARREWSAVVEPMRSLAAKLCGPVDRDVSLAQRQARVSAARER